MVVESDREREFPVRFHPDDGETRHDFVFDRPGTIEIDLEPGAPTILPALYSVERTDLRLGKRRALGVKLSLDLGQILERLARQDDPAAWQRVAAAILGEEIPGRQLEGNLRVANLHWDSSTRGTQRGRPGRFATSEESRSQNASR